MLPGPLRMVAKSRSPVGPRPEGRAPSASAILTPRGESLSSGAHPVTLSNSLRAGEVHLPGGYFSLTGWLTGSDLCAASNLLVSAPSRANFGEHTFRNCLKNSWKV